MSSDSSSDNDDGLVIYTANEILEKGLVLARVSERSIQRRSQEKLAKNFVDRYGASHVVVAQIWEDLQITNIPQARLLPKDRKRISYFLMAMHFLKRYNVESERALDYGLSEDTVRKWSWFFVEKIQALKANKIKWPDHNYHDDVWILTVDGVHCWCEEPQHPTLSRDPKYYSHKHNSAGYNYELGVAISESRLIWMNGPFPAGLDDRSVFKTKGLRDKLVHLGKKAIADGGYHAREYANVLSTPNEIDDKRTKKFKSRAQRRHEAFNGMIKTFRCLRDCFRHGEQRFKSCFEACCVIAQYQLENGQPLFEVYVRGLDDIDEEIRVVL